MRTRQFPCIVNSGLPNATRKARLFRIGTTIYHPELVSGSLRTVNKKFRFTKISTKVRKVRCVLHQERCEYLE
ncbi:hypothetical protein WA026_008992 [Henosepilachna vigintioctopunctata]|uniref:Uncharacterized protein n=1 Tax=Henosepilachna vigintioctopunctata TaxID=420089 RepID=A0AAW1VCZ1_9CUCU